MLVRTLFLPPFPPSRLIGVGWGKIPAATAIVIYSFDPDVVSCAASHGLNNIRGSRTWDNYPPISTSETVGTVAADFTISSGLDEMKTIASMSAIPVHMCYLGFSILQDGEARLAGERREGGLSSLSDGVVAVEVPSLPSDTPLMVHLSEEEVFIESEGFWN